MFNATWLYHIRWRKKKAKYFIVPAHFFSNDKNTVNAKTENIVPQNEILVATDKLTIVAEITPSIEDSAKVGVVEKTFDSQKSAFKQEEENASRKVSAFSLSSIKAKKELQAEQRNIVTPATDLPANVFSNQEMLYHWNAYAADLSQRGMKIMESLLLMNEPIVRGSKITLELPNEGSKLDFEAAKPPLLRYLSSKLNNHEITIDVVVNEIVERKFAFTAQDKYERLRSINPHLDLLKRTFDLDY